MYGPNLKELMRQHDGDDEVSLESLPSLEDCLAEADQLVESDVEALEAIDWGTIAKYTLTAVIVGAYITIVVRRFMKIKKIRDNLNKHAAKVMKEGGTIFGKSNMSQMGPLESITGIEEIIDKAQRLTEFEFVHPLLAADIATDIQWSKVSNMSLNDLLTVADIEKMGGSVADLLNSVKVAIDRSVEDIREGKGLDVESLHKDVFIKMNGKTSSGQEFLQTTRSKLTNSVNFVLNDKFQKITFIAQRKPFTEFALDVVGDTNKHLSRISQTSYKHLSDLDRTSQSLNREISDTLKMFEDVAASGATELPSGGTGLMVRGGDTVISGDLSKQEDMVDAARKQMVKAFSVGGMYGSTLIEMSGAIAKEQLKAVTKGYKERLILLKDIVEILESIKELATNPAQTKVVDDQLTAIKKDVITTSKVVSRLTKIANQYT